MYKIIEEPSYKRGYKKLLKDYKNKELDKLGEIIVKLSNKEITTQSSNHKLKSDKKAKNKYSDIHISGDIVLLYRYDEKNLYLQLHNIGTHKEVFPNKNRNKNESINIPRCKVCNTQLNEINQCPHCNLYKELDYGLSVQEALDILNRQGRK